MAEPSVQLAQRLAANDKKSRDRALRKLRLYLSARSAEPEGGFTTDEFCKIWKGLFYCMWMQDKPLLQEELALTMSQLVHVLQTRISQNLFIRSFWQTLNREWNGIDRLRLDKFYTLSRFILRQSIELLKKGGWEESLMEEFLSILVDEVLKTEAPRGVQHHLIDIYLEELAKIGSSELSADVNLKLIEPFCKIAAKAKDHLLWQSVVSGIFHTILDQSPFAIEDLMREVGHTAVDEDNGEEANDSEDIGPVLQFDYQALADRLFTLASRKNTPPRNRKCLYWLVKRFQDLAAGIFPRDNFREVRPHEEEDDDDDDEFGSRRFRKRQKKAQEKTTLGSRDALNEPEKKGKGKRQRTAVTPENPPEPPAPKKKRKKNSPNQVNGVTHEHPTVREETEECVLQSPPEASQESSSTTGTRLRRRRRSCLLRLGLSMLPLRGALMLRRRRLIRQQRKIGSKAAPMMSADIVTSTPARPSPLQQDFITFQKSEVPKPLYVKGGKSRGHPISSKVKCKSKKVTFSLNKNMTAEFRRTDRSLLVSPTGSSRVPFNPSQKPQHGVLKTPTPPRGPARRARAVDFF